MSEDDMSPSYVDSARAQTVLRREAEEHARQRQVSAATRRLLGKQVRVRLAEKTIVTGRLLGFGTSGEFEIEDDCGDVHYCWPMLSIEEARGD